MSINNSSKGKLRISRRTMLFSISFLLALLVFSVVFYGVMNNDDSYYIDETIVPPVLEAAVYVKNEVELRNAINSAVGVSVVIAPMEDIHLTESSLSIPDAANVTLASDSKYGVCKIFGASGNSTITVEDGGILTLKAIVITHENSSTNGAGIVIKSGGTVNMYNSEISGNTAKNGGGVSNSGTFRLYSGKISGNTAITNGGGLFNTGVFEMYNGEIINNLSEQGGGVFNRGFFNRMGGIIEDNKGKGKGANCC
jgi:hypothetical protein